MKYAKRIFTLFVIVWPLYTILHELGHFLAIFFLNTPVDYFIFGSGPEVTSFKIFNIHTTINILPYTGFIKIHATEFSLLAVYTLILSGILLPVLIAMLMLPHFDFKHERVLGKDWKSDFIFFTVLASLANLLPFFFVDGPALIGETFLRLGITGHWARLSAAVWTTFIISLMFYWIYTTKFRKIQFR